MSGLPDNIVIVVDNSNYNAKYAEDTPFRAKVKEKLEHEIWVESLVTGKEYELYYPQILECLEEDIIKDMINKKEYR